VQFKAIVTHISDITTIEEFAAIAILCSSTLITNKLIIDRNPIKIYKLFTLRLRRRSKKRGLMQYRDLRGGGRRGMVQ